MHDNIFFIIFSLIFHLGCAILVIGGSILCIIKAFHHYKKREKAIDKIINYIDDDINT